MQYENFQEVSLWLVDVLHKLYFDRCSVVLVVWRIVVLVGGWIDVDNVR
jgi:hypothetical protein